MTPAENPFAGFAPSGVHLLDEADVRARVGEWLASHEGLRSSGPTEAAFEALVLPTDDPAWRHRYADQAWLCAVRYRAALYQLGVRHPLVTCPYEERVGKAVADLAAVARSYQALREGPALAAYEPQAGDALCSQGPSGPHVSCVVSATWEPGARLVLECVDGGAGKKGDMAIERNVYLLDRRSSGPALRSVENRSLDNPGPPRPLVWGVDLWRLVLEAGLLKA